MIPHIIHQTWKTHDVPDRWKPFQRSWQEKHPDYEYRYWTDSDNRALIAEHYPDFLSVYDGYKIPVHRADVARYFIMRHFGGVYVDMDFEALKPLGDFLDGKQIAFGLEPAVHAARSAVPRGLSRIVCNAFIASVPGHPFWRFLIDRLPLLKDEDDVLDATGPFMLTRACDEYPRPEELSIIPPALLYPIDNEQVRTLEPAQIQALMKDAYAVHHWSGSWMRDAILMAAHTRIVRSRAPK